jgi:hypothetical protein
LVLVVSGQPGRVGLAFILSRSPFCCIAQGRFVMEKRREEPKAPKPRTQEKPKRFRIVKLEQRVAPIELSSFQWGVAR